MEKRLIMRDVMKCRNLIMDKYGLTAENAARVICLLNVGICDGEKIAEPNHKTLSDILSGDFSGVPSVAARVGVVLNEGGTGAGAHTPGSTSGGSDTVAGKKSSGSRKKFPEKNTPGGDTSDDIRGKMRGLGQLGQAAKRKKKEKLTSDRGGDIENVTGDIIQETPAGALPDNVPGLVMDIIQSYCEQNNIADLSKERQPRWGAACYMVGLSVFKPSKILHDIQREKINGGTVYDVGRVSALVDLWGVLCQNFCKAPLIDDFAHFAGLSDSWLYGVGSSEGLTPARTALLQKLKRIQESGLSGLIVDGRQNPTGALAALNHWHGWTQTREIIHTSGPASVSAPALPVFDGSGGLLVDSGGDNGGKSN